MLQTRNCLSICLTTGLLLVDSRFAMAADIHGDFLTLNMQDKRKQETSLVTVTQCPGGRVYS